MDFNDVTHITRPAEQEISREVLIEKYAKGDETTLEQVRQRVARALAQCEKPELQAKLAETDGDDTERSRATGGNGVIKTDC